MGAKRDTYCSFLSDPLRTACPGVRGRSELGGPSGPGWFPERQNGKTAGNDLISSIISHQLARACNHLVFHDLHAPRGHSIYLIPGDSYISRIPVLLLRPQAWLAPTAKTYHSPPAIFLVPPY